MYNCCNAGYSAVCLTKSNNRAYVTLTTRTNIHRTDLQLYTYNVEKLALYSGHHGDQICIPQQSDGNVPLYHRVRQRKLRFIYLIFNRSKPNNNNTRHEYLLVDCSTGIQKRNSWTYNFVEVSGHNLESSLTWGFCCGGSPQGISGGPWPDDRQPTQQVRGVTPLSSLPSPIQSVL